MKTLYFHRKTKCLNLFLQKITIISENNRFKEGNAKKNRNEKALVFSEIYRINESTKLS